MVNLINSFARIMPSQESKIDKDLINLAIGIEELINEYGIESLLTGNTKTFNGEKYFELIDNTFVRYDFITGFQRISFS